MSSADHDWQWREGTVARAKPHFELRYGSSNDADWSSWPTVALVGQPRNAVFPVQFLINERDRVDRPKMIEGARREIDFYLIELAEVDPWKYLQYHCGTASNLYSSIHWVYVPAAQEVPKAGGGDSLQ